MSAAASPAVTAPARLHLAFLDALRALAALFVVASHLYLLVFGAGARTQFPLSLANSLLYGHLAVSVFIVISGFCLLLPVVHTRQLQGGARPFYTRRARRILPPYFAALTLTLALTFGGFNTGVERPLAPSDVLVSFLLLQDVAPGAKAINLPLWSVAVEVHIYLFFPWLLWVWRRFGLWALLGAGVLAGGATTATWLLVYPGQSWSFACPWFIALFAFGMAAAAITHDAASRARQWAPIVAAGAALLTGVLLARYPIQGRADEPFLAALPWIDGALGLGFAALLVMLAAPGARLPWAQRLLNWRPLVWIGGFSYSLYLTHYVLMPGLLDAFRLVPRIHDSRALQALAMFGVGLPILVGLAYVFFLICERPFLSRRARAAQFAEIAAPLPRTRSEHC